MFHFQLPDHQIKKPFPWTITVRLAGTQSTPEASFQRQLKLVGPQTLAPNEQTRAPRPGDPAQKAELLRTVHMSAKNPRRTWIGGIISSGTDIFHGAQSVCTVVEKPPRIWSGEISALTVFSVESVDSWDSSDSWDCD